MNFYPFNHKDLMECQDNKAVVLMTYDVSKEAIEMFPDISLGHLCGYAALEISKVPKELQSMTQESFLPYINVPGGITYCEPTMENKELKQIAKDSLERKLDNLRRDYDFSKYMTGKQSAMDAYRKDMVDLGATYIVFGFDLAHAGHDDIHDYQDTKFTLKLCYQLEAQLLELIRRFPELQGATGEQKADIIDQIRATGDIDTDISPIALLINEAFKDKKKDGKK